MESAAEFPLLPSLVRDAGEEDAGFGERNGNGLGPGTVWQELVSTRDLGLADEEGQATMRGEEGGGDGKNFVKALDGAQGHERGGSRREVLGAAGEYIDVCQCKRPDGFAKEGGFFVVGFDQGDLRVRRPDFHGQPREAGAGAEIYGQRRMGRWIGRLLRGALRKRKKVAGGEERLPEMPGDDLFGGADGGEIDACIPAQHKIDVRRYLIQGGGGKRNLVEEGLEQVGNAGGVHGI